MKCYLQFNTLYSPLLWVAKFTARSISLVEGGSLLESEKFNSIFKTLFHRDIFSIDFFKFLHVLPTETTSGYFKKEQMWRNNS